MSQSKQSIVVMEEDEVSRIVEDAVRRALSGKPQNDEWMGPDELAQMLGIKRDTIRSLVRRESLPHYRPGKTYTFRRSEVIAWLEERSGRPRARSTKSGKTIGLLLGKRRADHG